MANPDYNEYAAYYPQGASPIFQFQNVYPGGSAPPGVEDRHTLRPSAEATMSVGLQQAPVTGMADAVGTLQAKVASLEMRLRRLEGKQ